MQKKYVVRLTDAEREMLTGLLKRKRVAAQKVRRCSGEAEVGLPEITSVTEH